MNALTATLMMEANGPGWTVTTGKRIYMLWAPRPRTEHGRTAGGAPIVVAARDQWTAGWDSDTGSDGDIWRAATLDEVLVPLPGEVEAAFRAAAAEVTQ